MGKIRRLPGNVFVRIMMNIVSEKTREDIVSDTFTEKHDNENENYAKIVVKKLEERPPFRNILLWRLENEKKECKHTVVLRFTIKVLRHIWHPVESIEIYVDSGKLGRYFYLPHNYCVVNAESIGEHVHVCQGVTIGKSPDGGKPVIGNNVVIYPNAVIAGKITIGNNVYIGANAFVNYDVPDNCTVRAGKSSYTVYEKNITKDSAE